MIVVRRLKDGSPRYLVRYETPLGREVSKTFSRRAEAESWKRSVGSSGIGLPASRSARPARCRSYGPMFSRLAGIAGRPAPRLGT